MTSNSIRLRIAAARGVAAASLVALVLSTAACGSDTTATQEEPVSGSPSADGSASPSDPSPSDSGYREPEGDAAMVPYEPPSGSAVQMTFACDSGTSTVALHPDGDGVAMTDTLTGVAHSKWNVYANVMPFLAPDADPVLEPVTGHDGELVITRTNHHRTGSHMVDNGPHAWPQGTIIDLNNDDVDCSAQLYLSSKTLTAHAGLVAMLANPATHQLTVYDSLLPVGGRWRLTATVESPSGTRQRSTTVKSFKLSYDPKPELRTTLTHVPPLDDFTKLTITLASDDGTAERTVTITRTP